MQVTGEIQSVSTKPSKYPGSFAVGYKINNVWYSCFSESPQKKDDVVEFEAEEKTTPRGSFWNITKNSLKVIKLGEARTPPQNDITSYFDKRFTYLDQKLNDIKDIMMGNTTKPAKSQQNTSDTAENASEFIDDDIPF